MCAPPDVKVGKEREGRSWKISRGRFDVLWRQYREDDLRVEKMESVLRFSVASVRASLEPVTCQRLTLFPTAEASL